MKISNGVKKAEDIKKTPKESLRDPTGQVILWQKQLQNQPLVLL